MTLILRRLPPINFSSPYRFETLSRTTSHPTCDRSKSVSLLNRRLHIQTTTYPAVTFNSSSYVARCLTCNYYHFSNTIKNLNRNNTLNLLKYLHKLFLRGWSENLYYRKSTLIYFINIKNTGLNWTSLLVNTLLHAHIQFSKVV